MNSFGKRFLHSYIYLLVFLVLGVLACTSDDTVVNLPESDPLEGLDPFQREIVVYFNEIALGFEFGNASEITRKWVTPMKIIVEGSESQVLENALNIIIDELNALSTDGFKISLTEHKDSSNFAVFFGSGVAYANAYPSQEPYISSNRGLFAVFWGGDQNLYSGHMYVDIFQVEEVFQRHLLREELTQSMGLAMDSRRYPESIFQQDWTSVTDFAPIDQELIRLLYHPKMTSNLDQEDATDVLVDILLNE